MGSVQEVMPSLDTNAENAIAAVWERLEVQRQWESGGLLYHIKHALQAIKASPFTFLSSVITGTLAYASLCISLMIFFNLKQALELESKGVVLTIYLKDSVSTVDGQSLVSKLKDDSRIGKVSYVTKDEALVRLKKMLGDDASILSGLDAEVPLPAAVEVEFSNDVDTAKIFEEFDKRFKSAPETERVEYSKSLIGYLIKLEGFISRFSTIFVLTLLAITTLVVSNTARLGIYAHREEISIMKLLGAKSLFIRAPYMVEGALQGLVAGLLGALMTWVTYEFFNTAYSGSELLQSLISPPFALPFETMTYVVVISTAVGILSSYLGTMRLNYE